MKQRSRMSEGGGVGMRGELSTEKVERKKAQKSVEVSVKSSKYAKDWEVIVERLIQALKDENSYVRWGAAGALGELGDLKAVEPLNEALKDKNSSVQERAAWALEKIGNKELVASPPKYQNIMKIMIFKKRRSEQ